MATPNFMIIGVARCGTTSLFHYLKQHPNVDFSNIKEPKYFSSQFLEFPHNGPGDNTVDKKIVKNKTDYDHLFSGKNVKALGEASSDYFYYHKHTAQKIKDELGDIKIIISIRNPIERSFSAFSNLLRDQRENLTFEAAIEEEENRIANNWDWMWAYKNGSLYAEGIKTFMEVFTNVKVILFEDISNHPEETVMDTFKFLEVEPFQDINVNTKYSHSGAPKNKISALLSDRKNPVIYFFRNLAIKMIPRSILEQVASKMFNKGEIPHETKTKLKEYFKEDILKTEKLLNRSLQNWLD